MDRDSGGESGHLLKMLIILSTCPDSPPVYRSTLSDGSYFVKKRKMILTDMNRLSDGEIIAQSLIDENSFALL